jgi:hypothetical protein
MVKKPGVNWQIVLIKWVVPIDELSSTLIADNMVTCGPHSKCLHSSSLNADL